MFGTVSRTRVKPGTRDEYVRAMRDGGGTPPGGAALLVFESESDPDELWIAVAFESKEAYFANSESADMKARLEKVAQFRAGEPEWHDGEVTAPWS